MYVSLYWSKDLHINVTPINNWTIPHHVWCKFMPGNGGAVCGDRKRVNLQYNGKRCSNLSAWFHFFVHLWYIWYIYAWLRLDVSNIYNYLIYVGNSHYLKTEQFYPIFNSFWPSLTSQKQSKSTPWMTISFHIDKEGGILYALLPSQSKAMYTNML